MKLEIVGADKSIKRPTDGSTDPATEAETEKEITRLIERQTKKEKKTETETKDQDPFLTDMYYLSLFQNVEAAIALL